MDAKPLFTDDREEIVAYFCSKCRVVKQTEQQAEECCKPLPGRFCHCGVEIPHKWIWNSCDKCRAAKSTAELKESLRAAEVINTPSHSWVYSNCGGGNDGYFKLSEIEGIFEDDEMPLFVYDCDKQVWKGLSDEDFIYSELEGDWFEDAADHVVDQDELAKFLENWNKKQTLHQFMACTRRIIVLDKDKFTSWLSGNGNNKSKEV